MKIKMGGMIRNQMANNLVAAEQSVSPFSPLGTKLRFGKTLLRGGGHVARGLDNAADALVGAVVSPGGHISNALNEAGSHAYTALARSPRLTKATAVALPLGLFYETEMANKLLPMTNDTIQEGRTVYANHKEFLAKKLAQAKTEKTAGPYKFPGLGGAESAGYGPGQWPMRPMPVGQRMVQQEVINPHYHPVNAPTEPRTIYVDKPTTDYENFPAVQFSAQLQPSLDTGRAGFSQGLGRIGEQAHSGLAQGLGTMLGGNLHAGGGMLAGSVLGGLGKAVGDIVGTSKGIFEPFMGTTGYRMNRALNPVLTRVKADELFAQNFIGTLGSEVAKSLTGLLTDVASKAVGVVKNLPAQQSMVEVMRAGDPYLSNADPEQLMSAYHTMVKFAPTLSTDENAVRSFLRQAASSGSGVDFVTIKAVADTEKSVHNGAR